MPERTAFAGDTTEDAFLDGRLILRQPAKGHRIGTDALLLAAATEARARVCDLGAGVGAAGLALRLAGAAEVVLVEREPAFLACARTNAARPGLDGVTVVEADVFVRRSFLRWPAVADQSFDAVATNPPYAQELRGRRTPVALKRAAHAMEGGDLPDWLRCAARLLKDGGRLTLIHRADRIAEVLAALPSRLGGVAIRPVAPTADAAATRILIGAVAGSRAASRLLAPLVLHDASGRFTPEAEALHRGQAALSMEPGPLLSPRR
jgi:tRNA1(Val) A37 N6-methylase TrmN6